MSAAVHETDPATRARGGLFRSVMRFAGTLVTLAQTRLELFTHEIREEVQRASELLVWAFIALLAGGIGLLFAGLTIILVYWETHRTLAAVLVTLAFVVLSASSYGVVRSRMKRNPRLFDATLAELARDREQVEKQG
jgi:uncharacterized membrane protein YqjE